MARKSAPGTLIHCEYCGEDFSATYKRCPFCGEKPSAGASEIPPKVREDKLEDDFVFEGADLFDEPIEEDPEDGGDIRGGKRVRSGRGAPQINWPRLVTFGCSLVIIVTALVIVFAYIYPKIHGNKPNAGNDPSSSVSDPLPSESQDPAPTPSQEPSAPVEPDPVVSDEPAPGTGEVEAAKITLDKSEFTLTASEGGKSYTVKATVLPSNWSGEVEWSASNPNLVKLESKGLVTDRDGNQTYQCVVTNTNNGKSVLRVTVTATAGEQSATVTVYCRPGASSGTTSGTTSGSSGAFAVGDVCTVTAGTLNVRSGPSSDYRKLGKVYEGDKVKIVADSGNGWYEIEFDGGKGYVSGDYIKK